MMKSLLTVSAIFEFAIGIGLLVMPAALTPLLLGYTIQDPAVKIICGITGAALMSIAMACWMVRSVALQAKLMAKALLFYNIVACLVLLFAVLGMSLTGIGLWPAIAAHAGLAVWCVVALRN